MKTLLVIVAAVSLLAGCATAPHHTQAWEYKTVTGQVMGTQNTLTAAINREVAEGWQFVSAGGAAEQWGFAVLKREKK